MAWTKRQGREAFKLPHPDEEKAMSGIELLAIQGMLGDELRGAMSQAVFADLLCIDDRTLRRYQHQTRPIPPLVAREARRLRAMRERGR